MVYRPNDIKAVMNEGMPGKANPFVRGNLYIKFTIKFPESRSLTAAQLKVGVILLFLFVLIFYQVYV